MQYIRVFSLLRVMELLNFYFSPYKELDTYKLIQFLDIHNSSKAYNFVRKLRFIVLVPVFLIWLACSAIILNKVDSLGMGYYGGLVFGGLSFSVFCFAGRFHWKIAGLYALGVGLVSSILIELITPKAAQVYKIILAEPIYFLILLGGIAVGAFLLCIAFYFVELAVGIPIYFIGRIIFNKKYRMVADVFKLSLKHGSDVLYGAVRGYNTPFVPHPNFVNDGTAPALFGVSHIALRQLKTPGFAAAMLDEWRKRPENIARLEKIKPGASKLILEPKGKGGWIQLEGAGFDTGKIKLDSIAFEALNLGIGRSAEFKEFCHGPAVRFRVLADDIALSQSDTGSVPVRGGQGGRFAAAAAGGATAAVAADAIGIADEIYPFGQINIANGLPMVGGLDILGNPQGVDFNSMTDSPGAGGGGWSGGTSGNPFEN